MVTVIKAEYVGGYRLQLTFNTGESGIVDLEEMVRRVPLAAPLRDIAEFQRVNLDEWPTLVWPCGFDLSPEYAYRLATGKSPVWEKTARAEAA